MATTALPIWFHPEREFYEHRLGDEKKIKIKRVRYAGSSGSYVGCWKFEMEGPKQHFGYFVILFDMGRYSYCEVPDEVVGARYVEHIATLLTMSFRPRVTLVEGLPKFFESI